MDRHKLKMGMTVELAQDLDKHYGIDAEAELTKILNEELLKALAITEESLKEAEWVEDTSLTSGKRVWSKIIFDDTKIKPLSIYKYNFEDGKLTHEDHSMSVSTMAEIRMYMGFRNDL